MEQLASSLWPFSSFLTSFTDALTPPDMSYNTRQLSPGGRRIANPGRVSESAVNDASYHQRNGSYTSPRSSGVIPLSTITYVNTPQSSSSSTRAANRHDSYSSRPRRSSLIDTNRASSSAVNSLPNRSIPTIVQADTVRPSSPGKVGESRGGVQHKKVYSIDDGAARLVADVNVPVRSGVERHHRRRDSNTDRPNRRLSDIARERGQKVYHSNGRPIQSSIDDEDAFSYTDPAGMYRDTEPRWREVRPRRGSLDRAGANRERPVSMIEPAVDQRRSTREVGPPPSTRGWDRINEGLGRPRNARDSGREVSQSPSRGRGYADPRDAYYASQSQVSMPYPDRYEEYGYDETPSPRRNEKGSGFSKPDRADRSVERRGFGIRTDFRSTTGDPYARSSDESLEQGPKYRDAPYIEPQRHNTVPDYSYHEGRRPEPDRRDRDSAQRPQNDPRDKPREPREKDTRRREDDRGYDRDYDSARDQGYDIDRERERERARQMEPPSDHERDRHHRRETDRKDNSPRHSGDNVSSPSLAQAATGGLAGVAAALGATNLLKKVTGDKSERDERDRERDRDRDRERPREKRVDQPVDDRENDREKDRDRPRDRDRGLGFAYETQAEPPKGASTSQQDRPITREISNESADKPMKMPIPAMDPNEEYRRRMEQIQRELGSAPSDAKNSGDEADRERRRREREPRQPVGNGHNVEPSVDEPASLEYLPPSASRRNLEVDDRSQVTASSGGSSNSQRRQSILDRPLTREPAEIIDNTQSEKRENRVRIVDPPTEEEERRPRGILKKPTEKFPEDPNVIREGVAPLKDTTKKGIPPGARWTKIDRRLVNPEALEKQGERFEERLDCVIVLRVLTKEEIQKLADLTRELREQRYEDDRSDRKAARRQDRHRDRHDRDEFTDDSENEFKEKAPRMLEAPPASTNTSSDADFVRDSRDRRRDRDRESDASYAMSGGAGRRE